MAASYSNIGVVYQEKGDLENALLQHQRALEIRTRVFGSEHPFVGKSRHGIGIVLYRMGKHEEALVQYQKALEVFLAVHGQEHLDVASRAKILLQCTRSRVNEHRQSRWQPKHTISSSRCWDLITLGQGN